MAYDNPGSGGGDENNVFHLTEDMFPKGMAKTLKAGEVIEFRVIKPIDGDGDVAMTYNTGKKKEDMERGEEHEGMDHEEGEGGDSSWESDLRAEMSPQNPDQSAGGGY